MKSTLIPEIYQHFIRTTADDPKNILLHKNKISGKIIFENFDSISLVKDKRHPGEIRKPLQPTKLQCCSFHIEIGPADLS